MKLRVGIMVNCPKDRGNPAFTGIVEDIGVSEYRTWDNKSLYVWVTVRDSAGRASVWPSNRLGYTVDNIDRT